MYVISIKGDHNSHNFGINKTRSQIFYNIYGIWLRVIINKMIIIQLYNVNSNSTQQFKKEMLNKRVS